MVVGWAWSQAILILTTEGAKCRLANCVPKKTMQTQFKVWKCLLITFKKVLKIILIILRKKNRVFRKWCSFLNSHKQLLDKVLWYLKMNIPDIYQLDITQTKSNKLCYLTISHRRRHEYRRIVTSTIFTSPEATNCFSIITLMIIWENINYWSISDSETSTNLAPILKTASLQCYNHRMVIIAGWSKAPSQS